MEFLELELTAWLSSKERAAMLDGARYYRGDHDILKRKREAIGQGGELHAVDNLPNNRIVDNQYAKHVDQKANYLLGKPVTFRSDQKDAAKEVGKLLGRAFLRSLQHAGKECLNSGIAWLYPYVEESGALKWRLFNGYDILPFWADAAHTELDAALRLYEVEVYEGRGKRIVQKVEHYTTDGVRTYTRTGRQLIPDGDLIPYLSIQAGGINWERLPLIPIKYHAQEFPLLSRCRSLQDGINLLASDFVNNMQEDVRNTVLVLHNYDGQDLGEFRRNLTTYGAVKVRAFEGQAGGVDTLEIDVNAENYRVVLELLKKALIENLRSYDGKDERMSGTPNQMNIQSMYCDIDLDANAMETELQAAFEEILWFASTHLARTGKTQFDPAEVSVIFNRDMLINESEAIDNCAKSVGILSDETILSMHPWVEDAAEELQLVKKQTEESDPYRDVFEQAKPKAGEVNAQ